MSISRIVNLFSRSRYPDRRPPSVIGASRWEIEQAKLNQKTQQINENSGSGRENNLFFRIFGINFRQ